MSAADFALLVREFVQQEAPTDTKLVSEAQEVYNEFVLFSNKQKTQFFENAQKHLKLSSEEVQRLYAQYERSFATRITDELKADMLEVVRICFSEPRRPREFEIAHRVYEQVAKRHGVSEADCTSYVKYCLKQIAKHSK